MKSDTILLSIHPQHVEKILSGEKRFEYRKRIPLDVRNIIVYATSPVKKIVAVIEVEIIMKETPKDLWDKTRKHSGLAESAFYAYFKDCEVAYAVKFKKVVKLARPKVLSEINVERAPQSYLYIDAVKNMGNMQIRD